MCVQRRQSLKVFQTIYFLYSDAGGRAMAGTPGTEETRLSERKAAGATIVFATSNTCSPLLSTVGIKCGHRLLLAASCYTGAPHLTTRTGNILQQIGNPTLSLSPFPSQPPSQKSNNNKKTKTKISENAILCVPEQVGL